MVAYANTGNPYQQYKQQSAMTASPGELTLMLYDGILKNLKLFKMHAEAGAVMKANEVSQKAQAILAELMRSLDMRYPLSEQLLSLYDFILNDVVQANVKKDPDAVDTAISMVAELRDTWHEAMRINRQQILGRGDTI